MTDDTRRGNGSGTRRRGSLDLYGQLRTAILNGEYRPADPLGEEVLASRYGVSRTPIREALRRLEQDGIIERTGRQLRVTVTTTGQVLEIYELRIVLESLAAEWAARQRTDLDLLKIEAALQQMADQMDLVPAELRARSHLFHERLWEASHNETLRDLLIRLNAGILRYPDTTVGQPGRWPETIAEHREILKAVADRDPELARAVTSSHLARDRDVRLGILRDRVLASGIANNRELPTF